MNKMITRSQALRMVREQLDIFKFPRDADMAKAKHVAEEALKTIQSSNKGSFSVVELDQLLDW